MIDGITIKNGHGDRRIVVRPILNGLSIELIADGHLVFGITGEEAARLALFFAMHGEGEHMETLRKLLNSADGGVEE